MALAQPVRRYYFNFENNQLQILSIQHQIDHWQYDSCAVSTHRKLIWRSKMSSSKTFKTFLIAVGVFLTGHSFAADSDANTDANDVAIHGYDTVAYFTKSTPTQGTTQFTATYKNTIYQFASAENRDKFRAAPEKYAPQFGGHCAMGVALNRKLDVDPTAWRIVEGKLYLNLNKQVQEKWLSDVPGNLKTAYEVWPTIKDKPAASL